MLRARVEQPFILCIVDVEYAPLGVGFEFVSLLTPGLFLVWKRDEPLEILADEQLSLGSVVARKRIVARRRRRLGGVAFALPVRLAIRDGLKLLLLLDLLLSARGAYPGVVDGDWVVGDDDVARARLPVAGRTPTDDLGCVNVHGAHPVRGECLGPPFQCHSCRGEHLNGHDQFAVFEDCKIHIDAFSGKWAHRQDSPAIPQLRGDAVALAIYSKLVCALRQPQGIETLAQQITAGWYCLVRGVVAQLRCNEVVLHRQPCDVLDRPLVR